MVLITYTQALESVYSMDFVNVIVVVTKDMKHEFIGILVLV